MIYRGQHGQFGGRHVVPPQRSGRPLPAEVRHHTDLKHLGNPQEFDQN